MEWIVVGLIVVSSSMVVCLGGVYYRLFWTFLNGLFIIVSQHIFALFNLYFLYFLEKINQ
jgi:hypothetical protein